MQGYKEDSKVRRGAELRTGEGRRVLVCDDERHIVRLIQANLGRQGYSVTCAYGGREAIECLEREEFDLAVVDRDMPDMSGLEVIAWIRSNERTKDLRIVLLGKDDRDDGDPPGADAFLTKPFNPIDLIARGLPD